MASETVTFRARREFEGDLETIEEWCREYGFTFNAVINSYLPAIAYALANRVFVDEDDKNRVYVLSDFGHVEMTRGKENQTKNQFFT